MTGQDAAKRAEVDRVKNILEYQRGHCLTTDACCDLCAVINHLDAAVAEAVKERDAEIAALKIVLHENGRARAEADLKVAEARREERALIADWFEETFCPRAGLKGDEKHANGDCDYCNMAFAIRRPPASAPEGEK